MSDAGHLEKLIEALILHRNIDTGKSIRAIQALQVNYDCLISEVKTKQPGESRHETAMRYIQEREKQVSNPASQTKNV